MGVFKYTLETASSAPLTLRIRSGLPGMLSETMMRAPDLSRISLTWLPLRPIMTLASLVTMRHRMWMFCAATVEGAGEVSVVGDCWESSPPEPTAVVASVSG